MEVTSSHIPIAGWTILLLILFSIIAQTVHLRWMHRLSRYPGPWLNSVSNIPSAVAAFRGVQHLYNYKLHERYGPVVRISPNELSFAEPYAWEHIYGNRHGDVMEKAPLFIGVVKPINGCVGIGLAKGSEHTRQRRAMAVGFTKSALMAQQEILEVQTYKLIHAIKTRAKGGKALNMSDWLSFTTFDIIGDLCFGESFHCLDGGVATEWALATTNVLISSTLDMAVRRVTGVGTWLNRMAVKLMPAEAMKWRQISFKNTSKKTFERLADETSSHKDVIYHIQRNKDARKTLEPTELLLNMTLLVTAGSETISTLLVTFIYNLCTHRNVYHRLATTIRTTFADPSEITLQKLEDLVYLDACIKEALRIFPPVSSNLPRAVPAKGAQIGPHTLPGGSLVSVAPWAAVRSARNFHLSNEYHPERWLRNHTEQGWDPAFENDHLSASTPFGAGPKQCMGQSLSYYEIRLIVAHLLWVFDFELETEGAEGAQNRRWSLDPDTELLRSYQTLNRPGLYVRFKERELI
ncbi:CypX Cytochrome P450 [Pyrenophora tritici-repentis]|uniref:CypX, Cytochrome P450 n=2 Tax=Pyrenophora tritici-repentis TaxID=45151 RepID=A0A317AKR7_9PLEO|nr:pisatin demethylase [Pyrenophora tritici-repentis Pt-1C-BFP]KAF7568919.1 CypX, Cytochrome P450 [Pyrenophora tritici-repentis]EDU47343.1 pisatin demethylase [Pyrenophora tritici-repentis Pt-1C-BFP]KAG9384362.1 Cytochrome P450 monooxygenase [Pyrenophora tritici-repentis]KAI0572122.1 monooxygenase cytochrome p450 [Pyrenophora tritici-repentis]KAI0573755.1 monooxygenase cytochrome p450 [Pyrenophora tritici-repentis]